MFGDAELAQFLPTQRTGALAAAIGRRLTEVQRLFLRSPDQFVEEPGATATEYFSRNSGPTELHFDGVDVIHTLDVWGEQLSIVVLPAPLEVGGFWSEAGEKLYRLSEMSSATADLVSCLGRTCTDVRIWTLQEDPETGEAKEAGVSYVLSDGVELFYCIYLHGDLNSDYLVLRRELPRDLPATCYSVAQGRYVDAGT